MKMKKKLMTAAAAGASLMMFAGCATSPEADSAKSMVTVVKLSGVGWFDRMEEGVLEFASETGIDARQEGADDASPEKQLALIQNLLAQSPTAITVVPNSPESLEDIFKQARDAGIIVVTHEAAGMKNVDADIEAFDNTWYGAQIMTNLAECMGEEGKYVSLVGGLTAQTHMTGVEGAYEEQKANFPNMVRVEDPVESKEDETVAYERAKELLAKYPDIKGFQGSAGTDVAGIGRAVQEAGLQDSVCVMGTSIPSVASKYLEDGSIDKIFFWDPALAGKAQLKIAQILSEGGKLTEGTDLGIEGYNSLKKLPGFDNAWAGEAAVIVDKSNASKYKF
jgi:simple sugar transport system substrate-binding protein